MSAIKLKIKKGDKVRVISGDDKGKDGVVIRVDKAKMRVLIEGINMVKRHTKPSAANQEGGIIEKEAPIHISNVMILDGDTTSKIGRRVEDEKIVRYFKKSDKNI
jgi:large subunit ribosomal protein L24